MMALYMKDPIWQMQSIKIKNMATAPKNSEMEPPTKDSILKIMNMAKEPLI